MPHNFTPIVLRAEGRTRPPLAPLCGRAGGGTRLRTGPRAGRPTGMPCFWARRSRSPTRRRTCPGRSPGRAGFSSLGGALWSWRAVARGDYKANGRDQATEDPVASYGSQHGQRALIGRGIVRKLRMPAGLPSETSPARSAFIAPGFVRRPCRWQQASHGALSLSFAH
jgi:hypothetical protein